MIKFKIKEYTLQEGHYTGPKDQDKVPGALEIVGKSALGGAIIGGIAGKFNKNSNVFNGALEGGKWGTLAGIALKFFINYLHNPMTTVKYQDVDKAIRREFGIYQATGIVVGDTVKRRANLDEKFSFNDREVTNYKINFSVQDNEITMYTFGISDKELDTVNKILDYYCKKYSGMSYDSSLINQKMNSYSVHIVFTNCQVIANYIMELSETLETKINLLDNRALVMNRLSVSEKEFSVKDVNKFDVLKIIGSSCAKSLTKLRTASWKESLAFTVMSIISSVGLKLTKDDITTKTNLPMPREAFGNKYLEDVLKKLHYVDGFNYCTGRKDVKANMSLISGLFVITIDKEYEKDMDEKYLSAIKSKINKSDTGKVLVYTYSITSKSEFEFLVKKLMSTEIIFNIFE